LIYDKQVIKKELNNMKSSNEQESFSMVQECTNRYEVIDQDNGGIIINIVIPQEFSVLWMIKLSDLRTTMEEIAYYRSRDEEELNNQ
jgi:hypothetical protein